MVLDPIGVVLFGVGRAGSIHRGNIQQSKSVSSCARSRVAERRVRPEHDAAVRHDHPHHVQHLSEWNKVLLQVVSSESQSDEKTKESVKQHGSSCCEFRRLMIISTARSGAQHHHCAAERNETRADLERKCEVLAADPIAELTPAFIAVMMVTMLVVIRAQD